MALSSSSPHGKTGERGRLAGGGKSGGQGLRGWSGVEGKERVGSAGSTPGRNLAQGGLRWPGHSGRRRRAVVALDW